jgi:poly(A) polymerase
MSLISLLQSLRADPHLAFLQGLAPGRVYLVGGAVRDALLGRETKDLDFVVVGLSPEGLAGVLARYGHVEEIESRAFGVLKFTPAGAKEIYDVALPRRDRWTGPAYKDMAPTLGVSLEEDLARRDFTVNALALSLEGDLVDPWGGQADLGARLIRAVGDPRQRFTEDPSRILRGLRLACELDWEVEQRTLRAMAETAPEVIRLTDRGETRVAPEVVGAEFLRGFAAQPARLIRLWEQTGLLGLLLPEVAAMRDTPQPEVFHAEGGVLSHVLLALERLRDLEQPDAPARWASPLAFQPGSIHTRLAVLLHDVGKPPTIRYPQTPHDRIHFPDHERAGARLAGEIADRLRLSVFPRGSPLHVDRDRLVFLVGHHMICFGLDFEHTRLATLERHFFNPESRGGELLSLIYADLAATIPPAGRPDFSCYRRLLERLRQVAGVIHAQQRERRLPHLLSGEEIMVLLGLPSGPEVGKVKSALREKQLQGIIQTPEEAREWLRRHGREGLAAGEPRDQ